MIKIIKFCIKTSTVLCEDVYEMKMNDLVHDYSDPSLCNIMEKLNDGLRSELFKEIIEDKGMELTVLHNRCYAGSALLQLLERQSDCLISLKLNCDIRMPNCTFINLHELNLRRVAYQQKPIDLSNIINVGVKGGNRYI